MNDFLERCKRVGLAFLSHLVFTLMGLAVFRAVGFAYERFFQDEHHLLFGKLPASYMVDAGDLVMFLVLIWKLSNELWNAFGE